MDWDGDLAQLAVVSPGNEQDVEAFLQMLSFFRFMIRAGTPGNVLRFEKACSDNLTVPGHVSPSWEWRFLTRPAALQNQRPSLQVFCCLQFLRNAELSSARDLHE